MPPHRSRGLLTWVASLSVAAALVVPLPAAAQPEAVPARGPIPFSAYDANADGAISEEEFNKVRGERMAGRAAEGRPMRGAAHAPAFSDFDADEDGSLTPDELTAGQRAQAAKRRSGGMGQGPGAGQGMGPGKNRPSFDDYDLDGDGAITEKEFHEARAKRISERAKQGYPMKNLGNAPAFGDLDSDGDGKLSPEEFAAHTAQRGQASPAPSQ